jgi:hypothetical protein
MRHSVQRFVKVVGAVSLGLVALVAIWLALCAVLIRFEAGDDDHHLGVGVQYSISSFEFVRSSDTFQLNRGELKRLAIEWSKKCFDQTSPIAKEIDAVGNDWEFKTKLSDGYKIHSDSKFCTCIDGTNYLELDLVVYDASGFQPDHNILRIDLDKVMSKERVGELCGFFQAEVLHRDPAAE